MLHTVPPSWASSTSARVSFRNIDASHARLHCLSLNSKCTAPPARSQPPDALQHQSTILHGNRGAEWGGEILVRHALPACVPTPPTALSLSPTAHGVVHGTAPKGQAFLVEARESALGCTGTQNLVLRRHRASQPARAKRDSASLQSGSLFHCLSVLDSSPAGIRLSAHSSINASSRCA